MQRLWDFIDGRKTYIVSAAIIAYAIIVVGWQGGDWAHAAELIMGALGLGGLRHGVAKL